MKKRIEWYLSLKILYWKLLISATIILELSQIQVDFGLIYNKMQFWVTRSQEIKTDSAP